MPQCAGYHGGCSLQLASSSGGLLSPLAIRRHVPLQANPTLVRYRESEEHRRATYVVDMCFELMSPLLPVRTSSSQVSGVAY